VFVRTVIPYYILFVYIACACRVATVIVIFYPLIRDRVLRTKDYDCKFLPDKNPEFVVAMAFVGHHVPCIVIVVCYAIVYYEILRLNKTRPQDRHAQDSASAL